MTNPVNMNMKGSVGNADVSINPTPATGVSPSILQATLRATAVPFVPQTPATSPATTALPFVPPTLPATTEVPLTGWGTMNFLEICEMSMEARRKIPLVRSDLAKIVSSTPLNTYCPLVYLPFPNLKTLGRYEKLLKMDIRDSNKKGESPSATDPLLHLNDPKVVEVYVANLPDSMTCAAVGWVIDTSLGEYVVIGVTKEKGCFCVQAKTGDEDSLRESLLKLDATILFDTKGFWIGSVLPGPSQANAIFQAAQKEVLNEHIADFYSDTKVLPYGLPRKPLAVKNSREGVFEVLFGGGRSIPNPGRGSIPNPPKLQEGSDVDSNEGSAEG